ncbi:ABC transporter substrate-binding protein [Stenotrophobium rhamnosiphilum]|uniref:ABC transporter substrate-binding protein n=1 Tax=Stenotrophobium rhamnosiphilum TaxID=2029166 RepID=A0A2T5MKF2_9GAMM|nr:ABC transporter substrate-binding protein [Stenotrophobium rhamnosiphilum]PTU33056.1 hypothetical protein CJD38_02830 [Stenotrophobium rhamnosiphilum]
MLRFFALFLFVIGMPTAYAALSPADTVTTFHAVLLDNMKHGASYSCKDRGQRLNPAVDNTFDMPFLAQHVLRRQWRTLSTAQQNEFTATLRDMVISTYAAQFTKFNGEKFTTLDTQDNGKMRAVRAALNLPSDDSVHFEYILRETPAGWRTINVIAEGVSDLALRSAQYDKIFKDQGFDGLIKQIKEQTAKLKASC